MIIVPLFKSEHVYHNKSGQNIDFDCPCQTIDAIISLFGNEDSRGVNAFDHHWVPLDYFGGLTIQLKSLFILEVKASIVTINTNCNFKSACIVIINSFIISFCFYRRHDR